MENDWRKQFEEFQKKVRERMEMGEKQYGNATFSLPMNRVIAEMQQEALDYAGYGFIFWTQLEDLKTRVAALETARN